MSSITLEQYVCYDSTVFVSPVRELDQLVRSIAPGSRYYYYNFQLEMRRNGFGRGGSNVVYYCINWNRTSFGQHSSPESHTAVATEHVSLPV